MSDTVSPSITLTRSDGTNSFTVGAGSTDIAVSALPMAYQLATIGTTEEALPLGDVATPGVSFFRNRDATNYVEIGVVVSTVFQPVIKLKPGESACFRFGTAAPYARAHTASVVLETFINSD